MHHLPGSCPRACTQDSSINHGCHIPLAPQNTGAYSLAETLAPGSTKWIALFVKDQPDTGIDGPEALKLGAFGPALAGTLSERYMRCGKKNCRGKVDPPQLHGPYHHWTRTMAGKTITKFLTPEQAERYRPWFENARMLSEALTALEARSLQAFTDAEK